MSRFVPVDRETSYLLPPSVDEWLPSDHLARFVVEVMQKRWSDTGALTTSLLKLHDRFVALCRFMTKVYPSEAPAVLSAQRKMFSDQPS